MKKQNDYIHKKLKNREDENALRTLKISTGLIDFCSNDYLGFSAEKEIHILDQELANFGATGSRLISGNHKITEEVEDFLAEFYKSESALIFNSGYNANIGIFSSLPQRNDVIIYDELIHASIRDGIKLSNANSYSFKHNSIEHLETKLKKSTGNVYVAVESIYSMDGDAAPIENLVKICDNYGAALIVDEAHAVGIYGNGKGLVTELNLQDNVFARVVTFGKAYGCHGAAVLGNKLLRDYLINYSRAFIYTTALPLHSILTIRKAHNFLKQNTDRIEQLKSNVTHFQKLTSNLPTSNSDSPIQCIIISGNDEVKKIAIQIQNNGFDVRPILSPTVPKGQERLRICLHNFNTHEQINSLIKSLNS
ncbi:pyridoxal phosphate-dependent aminotransferase family protein [Vicingus serpentipes]|uniref:Pyridoxal phosphate-dependent aminotransferase family protein n=1 Tax=Vicingus serpentipes TaxID=1926625 RepID=A0A5C6RTK5_9FLAO|nr:pyridoxal phosphate-dependent aminotransferase family protein [Vicingus serpentipes]TXB65329.1 pyridoxal phosphate-dependent aminotransferase family protein [Vicingus serpentipes]